MRQRQNQYDHGYPSSLPSRLGHPRGSTFARPEECAFGYVQKNIRQWTAQALVSGNRSTGTVLLTGAIGRVINPVIFYPAKRPSFFLGAYPGGSGGWSFGTQTAFLISKGMLWFSAPMPRTRSVVSTKPSR